MTSPGPAAEAWAEQLASWAVPEDILAAAPVSPWEFPTPLFARAAAEAVSSDAPRGPSYHRAREVLAQGDVVLDVGVGGGAASLPLAPPARRLVGVDQSEDLLRSFGQAATRLGIEHEVVGGRWPDVAAQVAPADVVVCHHVLYNVADVAPFVLALHEHARRRVVVELTDAHPMRRFNHLWLALHGVERPTGPTADDAYDAVVELGLPVRREAWRRPPRPAHPRDELVALVRRRLCVGPDRDAEIERLLDAHGEPTLGAAVTLWWDA